MIIDYETTTLMTYRDWNDFAAIRRKKEELARAAAAKATLDADIATFGDY